MTLSAVELGELVGLLAALAWSVTGLLVRAHGVHIHAIVINALRCAISSSSARARCWSSQISASRCLSVARQV